MTLNCGKKLSYSQSCRTDIQRELNCLESRQVERRFQLVKPKHKD